MEDLELKYCLRCKMLVRPIWEDTEEFDGFVKEKISYLICPICEHSDLIDPDEIDLNEIDTDEI